MTVDPNATLKEIIEQLFHAGGDYDVALELIEALAEWIAGGGFKPDDSTEADWPDVLEGAWWFCIEWHSGQTSDEYRVSCVIDRVYSPGPCQDGPEPQSAAEHVYDALTALYAEREVAL